MDARFGGRQANPLLAFQLPDQRGSDGQGSGRGRRLRVWGLRGEPMSGRSAGSSHSHRGVRPPR